VSASPHAADLALAQRLADAARGVSLAYFRGELRRWIKDDGTLATEADLAVEDALRAQLAVERPDDAILGEERGLSGAGPRRWVLDGIDGTVLFAEGRLGWGTLIALEIEGRVVVGVCDQPAQARRYWAARGAGAWCVDAATPNARALHVSGVCDLPRARSALLPPSHAGPDAQVQALTDALARATSPETPANHPALLVAAGESEVAVFLGPGPWDSAAPSLIVEEAGGRFSDLAGRHDLTTASAVYTNGVLHEAVLALVPG